MRMVDALEEIKKQHLDNYKQSIIEIIHNNTDVLVNEDIMSLLRKPPLDSMDSIKSKFLDLAKKNKIVLDTLKLDELLDGYRKEVIKCCDKIKKTRVDTLEKAISEITLLKDTDIIKINKKEFNDINKNLKKIMKEQLQEAVEKKFVKDISSVFFNEVDENIKKKISDEVIKFVKGSYQRQLLENIDFKTLVKDTTLANSVKEHGERYLFTLANSRIFKQEDN
ncbi:MAG: hypothetical protein J6C28_01655 [Bacilli bacterium]|nr:hypothetical protein [Bacilli bacterium]